MDIDVDIEETYKGSMNYKLTIKPSGYGKDHKGFMLLDIEDLERDGIDLMDLPKSFFRVCYAKTIEKRLEKGNINNG